jgi:alkylation response protein AidB-like acyl-CoA dehydrogenase
MNLSRKLFEEEHTAFRESVGAFVDREILPSRDRFREERTIDRDVWATAGRQGYLGLCVPEEYGGVGVEDFRFNQVFGEELARAGLAFGSSLSMHTDIVAPYLCELGTDEQKDRWLERFCSGEMITGIAMTEPGAGSDLRAIRTAARRDGSDWIINGSKTFITNGMNADLIVVAVRTSDDHASGLTMVCLETGTPGYTRGRKLAKVGQHEADTAELFFEDVRVPQDDILGDVGQGLQYMVRHLAQERLSSACLNVAHCSHILALTLDYVRERQAFGRAIGAFQFNRFTLAELSTELDVTQVFVDRCVEAHVAGELTAVDAAKAKLWSSDVQNRLIDTCLQLHGGYGYMDEYEVAHAWRDARVTKIWAGSNEIMKEIIGRSLGLGEPRR